jgi:hypothetical protein
VYRYTLVVLAGPAATNTRLKRFLWVMFNVIGLIVFGGVHQSGVAPATAALPRLAAAAAAGEAGATNNASVRRALNATPSSPPLTVVHAVYYRTYMPPRSLLVQPWRGEEGEEKTTTTAAADENNKNKAKKALSPLDFSAFGALLSSGGRMDWASVPPLSRWRRWNATTAATATVGLCVLVESS